MKRIFGIFELFFDFIYLSGALWIAIYLIGYSDQALTVLQA